MPLLRGYEIKVNAQSLGEFITVKQCHEAIKTRLQLIKTPLSEMTFELIDHNKGEFIRIRIQRDSKAADASNESFFDHWLHATGLSN